ncbi:MAG TPA: SDR family oxidoreductase [Gaiellaceae bacterium]|nr:SDR family oxidoreductase [Gaiellaceae bacterium]
MAGEGVALVTGASRGIGEVVATRLAAGGRRVVVAARSRDELARVAAASGALPVTVDVTDATAVAAAIEAVESELGPVDLLVNNAGVAGEGGPTWEKDPADWWRVFEVNVLGAFLLARAVLPGMCERGSGRVVNVASNAAFFRLDADWDARIDSAYQASKAALIRLTEALAAEARGHGVSVFAISPGMVKTSMTEPVFADIWDEHELWTPPERTAELITHIASGALDELSGRYIHAAQDDWETMGDRMTAILDDDSNALRLRTQLH